MNSAATIYNPIPYWNAFIKNVDGLSIKDVNVISFSLQL
jgi:hypothetical protein